MSRDQLQRQARRLVGLGEQAGTALLYHLLPSELAGRGGNIDVFELGLGCLRVRRSLDGLGLHNLKLA
jgi:hypothetical protein